MAAFRGSCLLAAVLCAGPAPVGAQALDAAKIREAATRGYAAIQTAQRTSRKSQTCASTCHLQGYGALSYRSAREHGIALDEAVVTADLNRGLRGTVLDLAGAVQGNALGEVAMNAAFFMVASHAAGLSPNVVTAALARAVAMQQNPQGDWTALYTRPPSNSSSFTFTAMGLRALQLYGHRSQQAEMARRVQRAATWLRSHAPLDTEGRAYQLIGMWWAGADRAERTQMARSLVATQRADGGWNSIEGGASNAYATGEALVALHDAGGVPATDAAWRRGAEFLVRTQAADGTWHVPTRLQPFISPPYFESGYPYGHDQFISVAGANWSVMALTRGLGDAVPQRDLVLSDATPKDIEPWVETVMFGSVADLKRLLVSGLSPNAATKLGGLTPLMLAAPDVDKMHVLLDGGANVNQRSAWKYSALYVAAQFRDSSGAIRLLLDRGAEIRVPTSAGTPTSSAYPLFFAAHVGNTEGVKLLRQAGDSVDVSAFLFGTSPSTPLTVAATFGHADTVRALLDLKANIDGDGRGRTPLIAAVADHHVEIVRLLIERGADVNRADETGRTPLHYAASVDFGDTAIADLLLKAGAKADLTDKEGVTARQMAQKTNARLVGLLAH